MTFLQRVLDSFSRGGVDLFRLRTSVKWASSFAHTIKDIRRLTRRSDILSFSACCLSPIPSGNHSSPAGGTGPPRLLVSCAVFGMGSASCPYGAKAAACKRLPALFLRSVWSETASPVQTGITGLEGSGGCILPAGRRAVPQKRLPLAPHCQNAAAGGEITSKTAKNMGHILTERRSQNTSPRPSRSLPESAEHRWRSKPKPKQVPPPDKNVTRQRFTAPFPSLTSGS